MSQDIFFFKPVWSKVGLIKRKLIHRLFSKFYSRCTNVVEAVFLRQELILDSFILQNWYSKIVEILLFWNWSWNLFELIKLSLYLNEISLSIEIYKFYFLFGLLFADPSSNHSCNQNKFTHLFMRVNSKRALFISLSS